jgi:hypothetical protein
MNGCVISFHGLGLVSVALGSASLMLSPNRAACAKKEIYHTPVQNSFFRGQGAGRIPKRSEECASRRVALARLHAQAHSKKVRM